MTLLSLIQNVASKVAVQQPSFVIGNTDPLVAQLFNLANEEGLLLARRRPWQVLTRTIVFTTVNAQEQTTGLPSDWDRFLDGTWFNRTTRRPISGPISATEWEALLALPAYASPFLQFRIIANVFNILPVPPAGQICAYEYITKNWAIGANPQTPDRALGPKVEFGLDTDTAALDERVMALGVRWRFLEAKGLDYAEAMATYEREVDRLGGSEQGAPNLTLEGRGRFSLPVSTNIPAGSWPLG